jgi:PTH1 family peptidyl-tRNA hydrolase
MLVRGEDSQLMNKIALALGGKAEEEAPKSEKKAVAKSHIHQARNHSQPRMPESGPMAEMLKRMFGKKDD